MAINVKDIGTIQTKFAQRASAAGNDYKNGVMNPRRPWAASASAASQSWADGVQQAVANGRFTKGVAKAGDAKWQANASTTGASRYPSGAQASAPNYGTNFAPYLQTIAGLNLPPRFPRGDPRNNDRVSAVTAALHAKKLSG
jgi:hypothetical protein